MLCYFSGSAISSTSVWTESEMVVDHRFYFWDHLCRDPEVHRQDIFVMARDVVPISVGMRLGELTITELAGKVVKMSCSCGGKDERLIDAVRAMKLRGSQSSCKRCRKSLAKKRIDRRGLFGRRCGFGSET